MPVAEDWGQFVLANSGSCAIGANDSDPDGDPLTFELVDPPAHGSAIVTPDGFAAYTPDADFSTDPPDYASDTFTYVVSDGILTSAPATVPFWVAPINDPPSFTAGSTVTVGEDSGAYAATWATAITPGPANESAQHVSFTVTSDATGLFSSQPAISSTGTLTFTPTANANGIAHVTVTAHDDGGLADYGLGSQLPVPPDDTSDPATFDLAITPVNDAPTANVVSVSAAEDTPADVALTGGDVDSSSLAFSIVSPPSHGALSAVGIASCSGTPTSCQAPVIYTPEANYHGPDSFTYRTDDGSLTSAPATASIDVASVNDPPVAVADSRTLPEDSGPNSWTVRANDSDPDGDTLTIVSVGAASKGTTSMNGLTVTYTPAPNANGADSFTYTISDGHGGQATATVSVTISAVNDPPSFTSGGDVTSSEDAGPQSIAWATNIDRGAANESGQSLTFTVVSDSNPALFAVRPAISATGTLTYRTALNTSGSATIGVRLTDSGSGSNASPTATFVIAAQPVNDAPTFTPGGDVTVAEDSGAASVAWATGMSPGPADESAQTLGFLVAANSNPGLFAVAPAVSPTGTLTFTPGANRNGSATVTLRLQDSGGTANGGIDTSAGTTVTITVTPVNDKPNAVNDTGSSVPEGAGPTAIDVLANDQTTPDTGETLTIVAVTQPANGNVQITGSGTGLTYQPHAGFSGTDTFSYTVSDGSLTDSAQVLLTVTPDTTGPLAVAPVQQLSTGKLGSGTVPARITWSATDAGSGVASYTLQQSRNGGAWTAVSIASPTATALSLAPTAGSSYRFRVRATDGQGNVGAWATGPTFTVTRSEETTSLATWSAGWTTIGVITASGGQARYATSSAASMSFAFTGRDVGLVGVRTSSGGQASVYVDGTLVSTVDLKQATTAGALVVFRRHFSTPGTHTLTIRPVGNGRVYVDGFMVLG